MSSLKPLSSGVLRIGLLSAWLSRNNGGVFEALATHTAVVRACGLTPVVIGLADEFSELDRDRLLGSEVHAALGLGPRQFGYSPDLEGVLSRARIDLLHLHGVWMYQSFAAANWARATGRPLLISPHGMLDPWITGRGRVKKAVARIAYERASWRSAAAFHALSEAEATDIIAEVGPTDVLIIPNPGPLPAPARSSWPSAELVYIGRIHPKKNLDALIEGWCHASDVLAPRRARLTIAGWGDIAHIRWLKDRISRLNDSSVKFVGPVYGEEKARLLAQARFAVLPSLSEGLPVAMLEAWASGTPTLMSRHCHLPQGFDAGAALDTGTSPSEIRDSLRTAFSLDEGGWAGMSRAASNLAETAFSTETVAAPWETAYRRLLGRTSAGLACPSSAC